MVTALISCGKNKEIKQKTWWPSRPKPISRRLPSLQYTEYMTRLTREWEDAAMNAAK